MSGAFTSTPIDDIIHVPLLNGDNYSEWKESVMLKLGWLDLDLALREDKPPVPTESSTTAEISKHERWGRANRLALLFMRSYVNKSRRDFIPETEDAKAFMKAVEEQFVCSDKALASTLIKRLVGKSFDSTRSVREHIMQMRDMAAQLKSLKVEISESFLVHFILISLPSEYVPFKISYNTHKEKWSINELLTMCIQEEERLKMEKPESAQVVHHKKGKGKKGQHKKNFLKHKKWLIKKGNLQALVFMNLFMLKFPIIRGGLILALQPILLIPCKDFSTKRSRQKVNNMSIQETR